MAEKQTSSEELDFNSDDYNSFYYTNEKQIKRMDDEFILSKITEKYPDFNKTNSENVLKQVMLLIANDTSLISKIEEDYDVNASELFKILYRNYDFVFNKCFITRLQRTIRNKRYARIASRNNRMCIKRGKKRRYSGKK